MHNFTWRLDLDVNGAGGDSARLKRHVENLLVAPSTASDSERLITVEGGRVWAANSFTSLDIRDGSLRNGRGRPTSYELVPSRTGTARHAGTTSQPETYTLNDFWVTAYDGTQLLAKNLPSYVDGEGVSNTDIVVWYTGSVHHETGMRDEDRDTVPVLWVGFELIPHNLFDRTPLFP